MSFSEHDSDTTSHKVEVMQVELKSEQQKNEIQLQERDRIIKQL